jgi:Family of unknown function (DUF6768)
MKAEKEEIDNLIKETLTKEEAKFYEQLEEQNLIGKLGEVYRGKLGWLTVIMNVVQLIFFVLFVFCVIRFLNTDETNALIKWTSAGFGCMLILTMLKLFVWMQMDKNDTLREIKRLELQIAALSNKL